MAATVMTVTGPIPANKLEFTLIHEHLYLDLMRDTWSENNLLNDPELTYSELMRYKAAGGVSLVDATSKDLAENDHINLLGMKHPLAVRDMARRTGLNIILGCGWYRETYYKPYVFRTKADELAEEMVRDVEEGIDGTDVRAGFLGEVGSHFNWISPAEERVLRATARAQKKTGLTIGTHATRGPLGLDQLDILQHEGVDPRRVIIGHCNDHPYHEYHAAVAKRGAFVEFEDQGSMDPYSQRRDLDLVKKMLDAGLIKHLVFSHDVCYRTMLHAYGGTGYDYIPTKLPALLHHIGVTEDMFHQLLVDNPRRAITGED